MEKYYKCSCSCSVLVVTTEADFLSKGDVLLSIYKSDISKKDLWNRVRIAWLFLRGTLDHDNIILESKDAKELLNQLKDDQGR